MSRFEHGFTGAMPTMPQPLTNNRMIVLTHGFKLHISDVYTFAFDVRKRERRIFVTKVTRLFVHLKPTTFSSLVTVVYIEIQGEKRKKNLYEKYMSNYDFKGLGTFGLLFCPWPFLSTQWGAQAFTIQNSK